MEGLKSKWRVSTVVIFAVCLAVGGLFGLLRPVPNGCNMTYMYPTYIPISSPANISTGKYGLYLYHEGWRKIDYDAHLKELHGVPVLFIPGNGGSYKQVRSLAAESDRAYQGGPLESTFYQESSFTPEEAGISSSLKDFQEEAREIRNLFSSIRGASHYTNCLDWFAVDLEGEHSAMDGRILEEHTEYVVQSIHRVLDQYKESFDARLKESKENSGTLPKSVILVGHSMGGFVARAAVVHPHLRNGVVETIITLSSPHRAPPVALQPSLGHFFSRVNRAWRRGYQIQRTRSGRWMSDPVLSNVVVVSISGGIRDYQVRATLASLEGIVPSTHGLTIGATGMRDVWLSMEHQSILWCNQLVVQVAHTMLHLIDRNTGQPFVSTQKRLAVFVSNLRSGIPQNFNWMRSVQLQHYAEHLPIATEELGASGSSGLAPSRSKPICFSQAIDEFSLPCKEQGL
uniref:GPI inositol-deacylase n=1 Tax=Araucaria cunninghamii TaxID=56994 RepID=A0A0D6QW97_ARACU